ncbi:hypothetical protein NRIC_30570 [Enterococcus florum]|uniref:NADP-dependent oxidoreductase domain-containing protein n=1 Tax=Enterococcus florum TaxID=2480627 RepID=A0A4P5PBQ0_9ENTE|nr:aldo/keto reductase [Enterococcus florum]GCF95166.1 hypothetical protein NRIC_30570 [Enterococcus florum]
MEKMKLGTNLQISKIGLGTINFGTKINRKTAHGLLTEYVTRGGNFIDTANNYAVWNGGDGGESERTIGEWISQTKYRDEVVIATKIGALTTNKQKGFRQVEGLSREALLRAVERSLKRLQINSIDLLYLHMDDFSVSQEEVMGTLAELVKEGMVKEIGCSNFYSWRIEQARLICQEKGWPFFSAVQQRYSFLSPAASADLFPQVAMTKEMESYLQHFPCMKLVAYSPLLKGQYNTDNILHKAYDSLENRERLAWVRSIKKNPNCWVLNHVTQQFGGSAALVTTSSIKHLREIMTELN